MNFTYENQGTSTYLVYTVAEDETIDSMTLGMLTNNKIPGLASTLFTQMDSTKYIKYNVSAHIPASQFFAGVVNKKRLLGVFKGIISAILSAEDYMIDESAILLDMDYIFADVTTCETVLVCIPVEHEAKRHDLGAFFKGIMFSTQFDQSENCDHVAKIINYLNSSPLFSLNDFNELLVKLEKSETPVIAAVQQEKPKMEEPVQPQVKAEPAPVEVQRTQIQQPVVPVTKPENIQVVVDIKPNQVTKEENTGKGVVIPSTPEQNSAEKGKAKGFSLFGSLFGSKDKKDKKEKKEQPAKQPKKQPAKQPAKPAGFGAFEVPNAPGVKPAFEVPGPAAPISAQPVVPQTKQTVQTQVKAEPAPVQEVKQTVPVQPVQPAQPANKPLSFGETTVLGGNIGETTVLSAVMEQVKNEPFLVRTKNNEKIPLNKPVFRIGKERSYVDYFIGDNTAVSRSHANIIDRNGEFAVVDTNSTNHTYVNGAMIQSGVETKLSHGDKLRLANEEFEFRMY